MGPLLRQLLLIIHMFIDITVTSLAFGFGLDWNLADVLRVFIHPSEYSFLSSPLDLVILCILRCLILLFTFILIRRGTSKRLKEKQWIHSVLSIIGCMLSVAKLLVFDEFGELKKHPKIYLCAVAAIFFSSSIPFLVWYVVAGQKSEEQGYERLQDGIVENGDASTSTSPKEPSLSSWKQVWIIGKICALHWKLFVPAYGFLVFFVLSNVSGPFIYNYTIFAIITKESWDVIFKRILWALFVFLLQDTLGSVKEYFMKKGKAFAAKDIRKALFMSIMRQPISFFDVNNVGNLTSRFKDAEFVADSLPAQIENILNSIFWMIFCFAFLFTICWQITLVSLMVFPVMFLVNKYFGGKIKKLSEEETNASAVYTGTVTEVFTSIREVRALGGEDLECKKYLGENEDWYNIRVKRIVVDFWNWFFESFFRTFNIITVLSYGALLVKEDRLSDEMFMAYGIYTYRMLGVLVGLSKAYTESMEMMGKSEQVVKLLNRVPEIDYTAGTVIPDEVHGRIVFDEVDFTYPSRPTAKVLNGLSLSIEPGMTVALVGPSGNGKSTIVSLLEQFYHPSTGTITIDDIPIQDIDHYFYRSKVALVAQDPTLFSGTVRDNIKYGLKEDVDDEEMIRIAKMANVHEFVSKMEKGYDTLCGVRGVQMSGGQKQRIAIARALIRNPKVLILDEATSALDAESEHLVQEALTNCAKGISVLVIAHRLSTIRNADKIAVIEKGQVMELGNHDELMLNLEGTYCKLVQRQTKLI